MTFASLLHVISKPTYRFMMPKSDNRIGAKLSAILFRQRAVGTLSVPVVMAAVLFTLRGELAWQDLALWAIAYGFVTVG